MKKILIVLLLLVLLYFLLRKPGNGKPAIIENGGAGIQPVKRPVLSENLVTVMSNLKESVS